jgi:hypothetical protein
MPDSTAEWIAKAFYKKYYNAPRCARNGTDRPKTKFLVKVIKCLYNNVAWKPFERRPIAPVRRYGRTC